MKYSVLSLDFWQNTAIYMGKSYPCGTIGCDALNISPGIINQLIIPCNMLCTFMGPLMTGYGNPALLPAAREGAMQITRLLKNVKPFSYVDLPDVEERIARIFSDASLANANAYSVSQYFNVAGCDAPVQVRTSGFSKFADLKMDKSAGWNNGTITLTGILSIYQGSYQFILTDNDNQFIQDVLNK